RESGFSGQPFFQCGGDARSGQKSKEEPMRTCPACGKENEDNVTHCATCDEEIGAGSVAAEHGGGASASAAAEGATQEHETVAVSLAELRAHASRDETGETGDDVKTDDAPAARV